MGRSIYCGEDFVWKYAVGAQPSEMYRINEELGLGEYSLTEDGDTLVLRYQDAELLDRALASLQQSDESYFIEMVKAIRDYICEHADREQFIFDGEF